MYDPPTFYLKNPFSVVKREKILKFRPFEKNLFAQRIPKKIKDAKVFRPKMSFPFSYSHLEIPDRFLTKTKMKILQIILPDSSFIMFD